MLGMPIDDTIILKEPIRLFYAFWIMCGFYMMNYLIDVIYCEYKYKLGDECLHHGKKYVKNLVKNGYKKE
jgi:hypothetical protein